MDIKKTINELPFTSGVYLMLNKYSRVIYVGKAVSLKKRVQSYFSSKKHEPKTSSLVREISYIDHISTHSEAEALILEASLIKKYKPKYNIDLRDDKSYPYVVITNDEFPRLTIERPKTRKKGYKYFGPYVSPKLVREALIIIRKILPFCICKNFLKSACLDYHLGLCPAPCVSKISKKDYAKQIRKIILILEGKKDVLLRSIQADMEILTREQKFEAAAKARDELQAIGALYSSSPDKNYYKEAEQLERVLNLPKTPQRIEAFDISNIMGNQAVGSMVSFFNGKPDKNNYRRFKIREVEGIDDFKMIAEVVRRRYRRLKEEKLSFPDLIVIDGGKGQLSAAQDELKKIEAMISIISLAKREEEIYLPNRFSPLKLGKDSLGLQLLQRIRDEAHRFAINYHRKLRQKKFILDE